MPAEDASLPLSQDVVLFGESLKASSYSDMQACVPKDPRESLQSLCTFCPITWY